MYMAKEKGVIETKYSSDLEGSECPDGRLRKGRSHREESQLGHWKWGDRALKNLPQGETYSKAKECFHKWWRYQSILNRVYNLFHLSTKINETITMFHALERMNGSKDWIKRLRLVIAVLRVMLESWNAFHWPIFSTGSIWDDFSRI